MLEVTAAREIVLQHAMPLPSEVTAVMSSALGQILAEPIVSDIDSPPFDKSLVDGYAVRSGDADQPRELLEEVAAGSVPMKPLGAGQTTRIYTGAPLPEGADAVVMQEHAVMTSGKVTLKPVKAGQNVYARGREIGAGQEILPAGTRLTPAVFGVLATLGRTTVKAYPNPRMCVLATGNELVEPNMKPMGAQIRNSNGSMLVSLGVLAGALPRYLGIARDDLVSMRSFIREGLNSSNVLVIAGGVSVGTHDLVPQVLQELGVTIHFHQVRMKPGKPLLFGSTDRTLVFGLPGNPVSGLVGFELFVKPCLQKLAGQKVEGLALQERTLMEAFTTSNDRPTYFPARLEPHGMVRALPWTGSPDLRGLVQADALLALPAGDLQLAPGSKMKVLSLNASAEVT